jgi:hypothetical protein
VAAGSEDQAFELYEKALQRIEEQEYSVAMEFLKEAIELRPAPGVQVPTSTLRYLDYLPYLFLGIAAAELEEPDLATQYLDLSTSYGAVIQSQGGQALLKRYRLQLANKKVLQDPIADPSAGLSQEEFEKLEIEIVSRCNLDSSKPRNAYPWYFDYELGLELLKHDDPARALESFLASLGKKDQPQDMARIYGMWYMKYAPFYNIGLAHYELGNYACMRDAFDTSKALNELEVDDESYKERERLTKEADKLQEHKR